jgi:hypothetical protein
MVCLAQTVHLSCTDTNTVSKFLSLWYIRCKPCTYLGPTVTLSPNGPKRHSTWPLSPRSSIRYSKPFLSLSYIWHKLCTYLHRHYNCLQTDRNEILHDPCHIGDPPVASKTIFEPKVCSAKTMHISCVKISTISKRTESSFHLSLVT